MLGCWQVLRCDPGAYVHPDELIEKWDSATVFDAPTTVATDAGQNTDDFDWWCRSTLTVSEPSIVALNKVNGRIEAVERSWMPGDGVAPRIVA